MSPESSSLSFICSRTNTHTTSAAAGCYLLIPADDYRGPEPLRYSYEGCEAAYHGEVFKLGPKVIFEVFPALAVWTQRSRFRRIRDARVARAAPSPLVNRVVRESTQ